MTSTTGTEIMDMSALAAAREEAERMLAEAQAKVEAAAAAQAEAEAQAKVTTAQSLGQDLTKALRPVSDALKAGDLTKAVEAMGAASEAFNALRSHITPEPERTTRSHRRTSGEGNGRDDVKAFFSDPERIGKPFRNQAVAHGTGRSSGFVGNITRDLAEEGWLTQTDDAVKTFIRVAPVEAPAS